MNWEKIEGFEGYFALITCRKGFVEVIFVLEVSWCILLKCYQDLREGLPFHVILSQNPAFSDSEAEDILEVQQKSLKQSVLV